MLSKKRLLPFFRLNLPVITNLTTACDNGQMPKPLHIAWYISRVGSLKREAPLLQILNIFSFSPFPFFSLPSSLLCSPGRFFLSLSRNPSGYSIYTCRQFELILCYLRGDIHSQNSENDINHIISLFPQSPRLFDAIKHWF